MKNVLIASIVGAVVFFAWGFIFWSALPIAPLIFQQADDEVALAEQLRKSIPATGTYTLPGMQMATSDFEEFTRRHEAGPVAMIFIYTEGRPVMPPSVFLIGYIGMLIGVFLVALLLQKAGPVLGSYSSRLAFVVLAGSIGIPISDLGVPVWYQLPWSLWIANAIFHLTSWIFVGLVLAKMVKPIPRKG
jgi:hypothetical protein